MFISLYKFWLIRQTKETQEKTEIKVFENNGNPQNLVFEKFCKHESRTICPYGIVTPTAYYLKDKSTLKKKFRFPSKLNHLLVM